jgi:ketosteroid isomerase-like protein
MSDRASREAVEATIARYNDAWNAHDVDAIVALHAPDMVFENHTAQSGPRALTCAITSRRSSETGPI